MQLDNYFAMVPNPPVTANPCLTSTHTYLAKQMPALSNILETLDGLRQPFDKAGR